MICEHTESGTSPARTGPLRNGNPRGDLSLARRCGAETRAPRSGPCRGPAMKNGRCRLHGGKSTGPRIAGGLARIVAARTKHGRYNAAAKAARRHTASLKAEACALLAAERAAIIAAKWQALLVLHRSGAHNVDTIAPLRLRLANAAAARPQAARPLAKTPRAQSPRAHSPRAQSPRAKTPSGEAPSAVSDTAP